MAHPRVDRNGNENDLIACIIDAAHTFRDKLSLQWVKGHQDTPGATLSTEAKLNVEADRLATLALADEGKRRW